MKMLQKLSDWQSSKDSQENVYKRVFSIKTAGLQGTECTSIIKRLHHGFLLENIPKTSFHKITFFKKFIVKQHFHKVRPCCAQPAI